MVWPGNINDHQVLPQVKDDLRGWWLGRVLTVVDRGFSSEENLAFGVSAGNWIAGQPMRDVRDGARGSRAVPVEAGAGLEVGEVRGCGQVDVFGVVAGGDDRHGPSIE